ncbi:10115_t:CDS:2 [Entrophospora sp. SA101]|nr:16169_t:CDS:2 [Entrophospora sp. SA101]CAJ0760340.1 23330_t:CDS:2 [Entrophospora sp. SA101]CAJ0762504.1 13921_t:CDS:2 [Entrophospora sp. SA101]CAJ0766099.1 10115_t:CDS:2 [Entrophospora sp. SA101]
MTSLLTNPRGIPKIQFVENVEEFMSKPSTSTEVILAKLQETVSKYKFMEINYINKKQGLELRILEIKKTLETNSDESMETTFELNDTLWIPAKVKSTKFVNLWLGANVMLEYSLQEAKELIKSKLLTAENSLKNLSEDLEFLREQVTTIEVNTARIYNWDVKIRRLAKSASNSKK